MPDKYKYYITSRLGTRQVNPLGKLEFSYDSQVQDFRRGYAKNFGGKITFTGEDFNWLYTLEHSIYRCEAVAISISKYCGGTYIPNWQTGKILFNKASWNLDLCSVEVQFAVEDKYTCYEAHKDTEINVLQATTSNEVVTLASGDVEYLHLSGTAPAVPDVTKWALYHEKIVYSFPSGGPGSRTVYADYATYNMGGGVFLPALVYGPVYTHTDDGAGTTADETTYSIYTSSISIDNGMKLQDVFETFLSEFCMGITLKSNFFQWRPTGTPTHINYVTGETSKVENLVLFQKSDVKRPNVSGNATIATLTFEALLKNICTIFNCLWDIEDDGATFRIEHYSYWQSVPGLDLTQPAYKPYTALRRRYTYQIDSMPKFEKFKFMESGGQDFDGADIWYDSACVSTDESNKNNEYEADKITTDVALVMAHPESDSKVVSDEGFVLAACYYGSGVIITEHPVLTTEYRVNNSLAWAQLHRDYYRHGRVLLQGYMNRNLTTFATSIKTKLQDKLSIPLCCDDEFNPDDLITTSLGSNGQVSKASYNLATSMLELEVLFDANDGLYVNHAPSALPISVVCTENSHVDIDITSFVSDADGDIDLSSIGFFSNTFINGTAVMLSPGIIRYTPDTGFTGGAYFYYYVKDRFNEPSADAMVTVTVTAIATAVNDAYVTFTNEAITIATPGVLANDAGTGLTVTGYDVSSVHGGTVVVNSDGSFTYTPAAGYAGSDSFTYTVTDGAGHAAVGTVSIDVRVRQMVYVKLVQTVTETHPIPFGSSCTTPDYRSKQQLSSVVAYYYSNSAGTLPFDISHYNLTIYYKRGTVTNYPSPGAPSYVYNSFVTTSGASQAVFAGVETHRALYDCHTGAYGGTDFTDTYTLTTSTGYTII